MPEELPCVSQAFGMLKNGKMTFSLGLMQHCVPQNYLQCKGDKKAHMVPTRLVPTRMKIYCLKLASQCDVICTNRPLFFYCSPSLRCKYHLPLSSNQNIIWAFAWIKASLITPIAMHSLYLVHSAPTSYYFLDLWYGPQLN